MGEAILFRAQHALCWLELASDGTPVFAQRMGGPDNGNQEDTGSGIALSTDGDLLVAGDFFGSRTVLDATLDSQGMSDAFVLRYRE